MHEKFRDDGFEIVGFPCNQFMSQEPWENDRINKHVKERFDVRFPLSSKIDVNGKNADKIFKYLRSHSELYRPVKNSAKEVPWNFTKFILDSTGEVVKYVDPKQMAEEAENDIRAVLENQESRAIE